MSSWDDRYSSLAVYDGVILNGAPSAIMLLFFFFQAEDGIRDVAVTGVQTCALPISSLPPEEVVPELRETLLTQYATHLLTAKDYAAVGRALRSPIARRAGLTATMHWLLGLACIECQHYTEGSEHLRQCLAKRSEATLSLVDRNILKAGPHHCLALCLAALKQNRDADQAFRAALEQDPNSRQIQFDYARFLADTGNGVDALKCIHQLIAAEPSNPVYWHFGGQVALSRPEFFGFALDWTGEALQFFPAHAGLVEHRAQALLLNGRLPEALPLWQQLGAGPNPAHRAALVLCLAALDQPVPRVPEEIAARVNQEFLAWYRRLLAANAGTVIRTLNDRMEILRAVVPGAVRIVEAAMAEASAA